MKAGCFALSLALAGCVIGPGPGPGTDSDTTDSATSTSGADDGVTDDADSGDTGVETCLYHCFSAPPITFPYNLDPVDENGDPVVTTLECELFGGGTLDLMGEFFPIDEPACAQGQDSAQVVTDIGVCDPGPVPQPPAFAWENWAAEYAFRQQRECVTVLTDMGCLNSVPGPANGAEELCDVFLRHQLEIDTLQVAPQLEEVEPQMLSINFGVCDFAEPLECGGGLDETG